VYFHKVFAVRGELVFEITADFGVGVSGQGNGNVVLVVIASFPAFTFDLFGRRIEIEVLGSVVRVDAGKSFEVEPGVIDTGERSERRLLDEKLRRAIVTDVAFEKNYRNDGDCSNGYYFYVVFRLF
jgi:hypothetical protein